MKLRILGILLGIIILFGGCYQQETTIVTREVVVQVTATPAPTATATPIPPTIGGGSGLMAFTVTYDEYHNDILVMDMDGANQTNLTNSDSPEDYVTWSPDGEKLAFVGTTNGGNREVFILNVMSGELRQVTDDENVNTAPSWSPDGITLAFFAGVGDGIKHGASVILVDAGGINQREIFFEENSRVIIGPQIAWSPDGSRLALGLHTLFLGPDRVGPDGQIYLVNADGSGVVLFGQSNFYPEWSPDGSTLLFFVLSNVGWDIFTMNVEESQPKQLTDSSASKAHTTWSPDGTQITYVDEDPPVVIIMNSNGANKRQLVDFYSSVDPEWSPDGQWIAFAGKSKQTSYYQVYIVKTDGSNLQMLTNTPEDHALPLWQP